MSNTRATKDIRADTIESGIIKQKSETIAAAATGVNALSLDYAISFIDTTAGAAQLGLGIGPAGQTKVISLSVDGGDATLTKANGNLGASVATSIVFADAGDSVQLFSTGSAWELLSNVGATVS